MAVLYVSGALLILILNFDQIIPAFVLIVQQAFRPESLAGGGVASIMITVMWGIRRGLFSNEAGQGSAPIAHATAKTKEPVREGLVASLGPFIDTLVICTMTGLVIVTTGAYKDKVEQTLPLSGVEAVMFDRAQDSQLISLRQEREGLGDQEVVVVAGQIRGASFVALNGIVESPRLIDAEGGSWSGRLAISAADGAVSVVDGGAAPFVSGEALLTGAEMTARGFTHGLGGFGGMVVTLAVILFAVSTGISWSYYGDRAVEYLFGPRAIRPYRWLFIFFFFMGCILPLKSVWTFGDVALGLMTFPNLLAVLLLTGGVVSLTKDYFSREHKPYS
jgi:AGCS family alanine or glycine:cation symporter